MVEKKKKNRENRFRRFTWKQRFILYAVTILLAVVYIFVFSDSNYRQHKKLNNKIAEFEKELKKQEKTLAKQNTYKNLQTDPQVMERYRREVLNMKKENEDLFIIKE